MEARSESPTLNDETLLNVLAELVDVAGAHLENDRHRSRDCLERAAVLLRQQTRRGALPRRATAGGLPAWRAEKIRRHVDEHLTSTITSEDLTAVAGMSTSHFFRSFKISFGETPFSYVARCRIQRAQQLMLTTDAPLCEIALACGFCDQSHFTRVFRRYTGRSPYAWRRMAAGAEEHRPAQAARG